MAAILIRVVALPNQSLSLRRNICTYVFVESSFMVFFSNEIPAFVCHEWKEFFADTHVVMSPAGRYLYHLIEWMLRLVKDKAIYDKVWHPAGSSSAGRLGRGCRSMLWPMDIAVRILYNSGCTHGHSGVYGTSEWLPMKMNSKDVQPE
jgi:hypothetical protein